REIQREAILKIQAREHALFDSMVEGLLLLDKNGRIQLVNRALEKLFGITSNIYGKTIMEAFRNRQLAGLASRLEKETQITGAEIELAELQARQFQVNAAAISETDGTRRGMIFVFHDLTRLKELENTRQEFVANVSHELRTPLSMIKGYVETLLNGAKDDPEVAQKFLQTIERHADRLTYLIEDLLTISRLESGQIQLNLEPKPLRPLVEKVMEDLQNRAAEKSISLVNDLPADLRASADLDRLEQVFWNLIDNAVKYGRSSGKVVVGGGVKENQIEIWVQDDGPGIPADSQERIFERFYRVDKARSREQGGTGLGLAIVKHVVQAHGGKVWVESEPRQGTIFFFTLAAEN
ncbi:MAG: ATP-binding protein, partial [Verrucomicrobiota bacterium]